MRSIDDLLAIMARLRDREHGYPWDLEQTFEAVGWIKPKADPALRALIRPTILDFAAEAAPTR